MASDEAPHSSAVPINRCTLFIRIPPDPYFTSA